MNMLLFGIYPYIAIAVCILGCWWRFKYRPMSVNAESDMVLSSGTMHRIGVFLFHGVVVLMPLHAVGLLMPHWMYAWLFTAETKQWLAMTVGGALGALIEIGIPILLWRRIFDPVIRRTSNAADYIVLALLFYMNTTGLWSIWFSAQEHDARVMLALASWAQHIMFLFWKGDAAGFVAEVPLMYQLHIVGGLTLIALVPFTRLVHLISGYKALTMYWWRPHKKVRTLRPMAR